MYTKHINFVIKLGYMFRLFYGRHQAYYFNDVTKTFRTLLGSQ